MGKNRYCNGYLTIAIRSLLDVFISFRSYVARASRYRYPYEIEFLRFESRQIVSLLADTKIAGIRQLFGPVICGKTSVQFIGVLQRCIL